MMNPLGSSLWSAVPFLTSGSMQPAAGTGLREMSFFLSHSWDVGGEETFNRVEDNVSCDLDGRCSSHPSPGMDEPVRNQKKPDDHVPDFRGAFPPC